MKRTTILCLPIILSACASAPPTVITYHLPKAAITLEATQTLLCYQEDVKVEGKTTGKVWRVATSNKVSVTPSYIADYSKEETIKLGELDSWYADTETTVGLTDDGRLSSISSASTGLGKSVLKASAEIVSAAASAAALVPSPTITQKDVDAACAVLVSVSEKDKPKTFTRSQTFIDFENGTELKLKSYGDLFKKIDAILPEVKATVQLLPGININKDLTKAPDADKLAQEKKNPVYCSEDCSDIPSVKLRKLYPMTVTVMVTPWGDLEHVVASKSLLYPDTSGNSDYSVPLYKDTNFFGKVEVDLKLGSAGEISSIKYGTSGSDAVSDGITTVLGLVDQESEYDKLKAANDLAYEQARQVACKANPTTEGCK